ncbi:MAG TPA: PolC-type DNA polymerase III [Bacilli bacterium]|nr:PolC-type DNA polymerase III [Bacilli bacterium]
MSDELKRFFRSISFVDKNEDFKEVKIAKVIVKKKNKSFSVFLVSENHLNPSVISKLLKKCTKGINGQNKVNVNITINNVNKDLVIKTFKFILKKLVKKRPSLSGILDNNITINDKEITIEVESKIEEKLLKEEKENLIKLLEQYGYKDFSLKTKVLENKVNLNERKTEVKVVVTKNKEPESNIVYGNAIKNENNISLNNIINEIKDVVVEAYVFGIDYVTRDKVHLINLKISDDTDSLLAKIKFFGKALENSKDIFTKISENNWYKIEGYVEFDTYAKDLVLNIRNMENIPSKRAKRVDEALDKRVELHTHTFMSQMDSVVSVKALIKQAKAFGHTAIAITDHNGLQSYPEAYKEREGIKIIYGVEMNVIDDDVSVVHNLKDYNFKDQTYVVFDTETTGFNAASGDQMIEIGAVKIKNGEIIDRFDELIDPKRKLPPKITEITGITDKMLKGKRNEEEVLKEFLKWVKDLPMVAHNAKFDISFLEIGCSRYKLPKFANTVIDTLELSRMIDPDEYKHNLSVLTKRYNIEFDEGSHHRADYDAEATAKVFHKMIKLFLTREIDTVNKLVDSIDLNTLLKFNRPYHMTIYAQNSVGLKNLFRIVSLANTKYIYKVPRIPKSEIIKNKEGLILGSGCVNGEVFNAAKSKTDDELRETMLFYDFIEVNPPSICEYLIERGEFTSKEDLLNNIKKIIEVAKSIGKKVCATGDVHQLNKEDTIYRKIIVNQKIPTVGFHPLFRRDKTIVPDMYFMNTKEMKNEFTFLEDEDLIEEIVVKNPNDIASLFEELQIIKDKLYTPVMENSDSITRDMVYKKAHKMYGEKLPELIEERLEKELNGIISNGYSVLYLIAEKLVKKSNDDGYFVGSRGSVGSSLVATMMDITEVNPLPPHYLCPKCHKSIFEKDGKAFSLNYKSGYDLPDFKCPDCHIPMQKEGQDIPFSSFLGWNAEKVPDIDLNFSSENQSQAHDYTKVLFGEENVFRAGTIGTVADKTAYGFVKGYCEDNNIIMRSMEIERLAKGITGIKRTTGQHPGGIIVIPRYMDVFDFTPYQYPADDDKSSWYTTHFDFHAIHDNVLKLDILGHDDPTMLKALEDLSGIKITSIPFDDPKVLSIFNSPKVLGVTKEQINAVTGSLGIPEFGTNFAIRMLEETKPKCFSDLVKISGLAHGTNVWNGNIRELIMNKTATFDKVLGCREDLISDLIGYGIPGFDAFQITEFVRKNLGNKNQIKFPEKWEKISGQMKESKVPDWYIASTKKIQYLFPKAHATAYVMMAYRVAWFKVYHPIYYYAAYFSKRCNDFDVSAMVGGSNTIRRKITEITLKGYDATNKEKDTADVLKVALEMCERGLSFKNINLTMSDGSNFVISEDQKSLYIPFRALEGLGDTVASKIIEERNEKEFTSVEDFQQRCHISKTTTDKLRSLGVLEGLPESSQLSLF